MADLKNVDCVVKNYLSNLYNFVLKWPYLILVTVVRLSPNDKITVIEIVNEAATH